MTQPTQTTKVRDKKKQTSRSSDLVNKLKKANFRVYIKHLRKTEDGKVFSISKKPKDVKVLPRGGTTIISIEPTKQRRFTGEAYCHPNDNYDNNIGTLRALGEALKNMKFTDPDMHKAVKNILNS